MRWPSANSVSKAKEDFPEPESPVTTTNLFLGIATLRLFRLFTRAFLMIMNSLGSRESMDVLAVNVLKVIGDKVTKGTEELLGKFEACSKLSDMDGNP
jgi:hypothetical protein